MKKSQKKLFRILSFISGTLLVVQSFLPGFFAIAQLNADEEPSPADVSTEVVTKVEAEPPVPQEPTSASTEDPTQTDTPQTTLTPDPTPTESLSPTPTPVDSTLTPTLTETPAPTSDPSATPSPQDEKPADEPNSNVSETGPPTTNPTPDATPTPSIFPAPTPTPETVEKVCSTEVTSETIVFNWDIDSGREMAQTRDKVALGTKYVYPFDSGVSVTFTCLPKDEALRSTLKIERVKISDLKLPEGVNPDSEYAYDITTGMENGTFEYTVTLPKPEGKTADVSYIEKSVTEAKDTQLTADDVKSIEKSKVNQEEASVKVTSLDHFTIYIVSTYANSGLTIPKSTYNQGETVYAKGTSDDTKTLRLVFRDNHNNVVKTCPETTGTVTACDYTLSGTADIGTWKVELERKSSGSWSSKDTANFEVIAPRPTPVANPTLSSACGLDIALVIDNSNSIDSTELGQMKTALTGFVTALSGTPTQFSVTKFGTNASVVQSFTSNATDVINAINGVSTGGGGTDWQKAIIAARGTFDPRASKPNLMIFASDGNPTFPDCGGSSTCQADVDHAITEANIAKSSPLSIRILALGIGGGLSTDNLIAISGPSVNTGNVLTSDVITTDFNGLAAQLAAFATQTCGGTITVNKYIDTVSPSTRGGAGWTFQVNGATKTTDSNGQTEAVTIPGGSTVSVTETGLLAGYAYGSATCRKSTGAPVGSPITQGVGSITVGANDIISCDFINTTNPTTGTLKVIKNVVDPVDPPYPANSWSIHVKQGGNEVAGSPQSGDSNGTVYTLPAGSYQIEEPAITPAPPNMYKTPVFSGDCVGQGGNSRTADVTVVVGQQKTCTITNTRKTGTVKIDKQVDTNGDGVFEGDNTIANNLGFRWSLNGGTADKLMGTTATYGHIGGQGFTINENSVAGYHFVGWYYGTGHSCSNPSATILPFGVPPSEGLQSFVLCNARDTGTITLDKITNPSGDPTLFNLEIKNSNQNGGYTPFGTYPVADSTTPVVVTVPTGWYGVDETAPAGWTRNDMTCVKTGSPGGLQSYNFNVNAGENVTCTFTNTLNQTDVTITKTDSPDPVNNGGMLTYTLTASNLSSDVGATNVVVTDTLPGGLTPSSVTPSQGNCSDQTLPNPIRCELGTLPPLASATITIVGTLSLPVGVPSIYNNVVVTTDTPETNTQNNSDLEETIINHIGTLRIVKNTIGGDDTFGFTATGYIWTCMPFPICSYVPQTPTSHTITTSGGTNSLDIPVTEGPYDVDETTIPTGWSLTGSQCGDPTTGRVTVVPGQTTTCTFTNTRQTGKITIIKDAVPNDGQDFSFTTTAGLGSFILDDDGNNGNTRSNTKVFATAPTGAYTITENTVSGWKLTNLVCNDTNGSVDLVNRKATINLETGEDVTCTFTNTELGSISGFKYNDKNGDNDWDTLLAGEGRMNGWRIFIDENDNKTYDAGEKTDVTAGWFIVPLGQYSIGGLLPGTYQVCEEVQTGWYSSMPGGVHCQSVTIGAGEDKSCVHFGNHEELTVKAYKVVCDNESDLPNWGNGGPNITASTAQNYVNSHPACRLESGWDFQYGFSGQVSKYGNGDQTGLAPEPWMMLGSTDGTNPAEIKISDLQGSNGIWVRENLKPGFLPFSYPPKGPTEDNVSAEMYCHHDVSHYDNYDQITNPLYGHTYYCVAFNKYIPPKLEISKENDATGDKNPGESVLYTITVKALDNAVHDVKVTDLLPAGFVYRPGSGTQDGGAATFEDEYGSPGIWLLGDIAAGQEVILTLIADISGSQYPGTYKDLALAHGCANAEACKGSPDVIALAVNPGKVDETFVGTDVTVVKDQQDSKGVTVKRDETREETKEEQEKREAEQRKLQQELPATGADTKWLFIAVILLTSGISLLVIGSRILRRHYA